MQRFSVKSFSNPGQSYDVIWRDDGSWDCNCTFKLYHPYKICEHILKAQGKPTRHLREASVKFNKLVGQYKAVDQAMLKTNIGQIAKIKRYYERLDKLRDRILTTMEKIKEIKG